MGATCCRCQPATALDDALLQPTPTSASASATTSASASASSRSAHLLAALTDAEARSARVRRRLAARGDPQQRMLMSHALANYVFPFPFARAIKPKPARGAGGICAAAAAGEVQQCAKKSACSKTARQGGDAKVAQSLGEHYRRTADGRWMPLSLMELCLRGICARLVVEDRDGEEEEDADEERNIDTSTELDAMMPPELAAQVLRWLQQHDALQKPHFQRLALCLLDAWDLHDQVHVDSSWFDGMNVRQLQRVRSLNVARCQQLEHLGSERWLQVPELPQLVTASFRGCTNLHMTVPYVLQASKQLQSLDLSGCHNIDDRSLVALRRLFNLQKLCLSGCRLVTDAGIKCLSGLSKLQTLLVARCTKLTDDAFEDMTAAYPALTHLDVAHCRLSDVALVHIATMVTLKTLVLRGCRHIGDIGVERLATLVSLQSLDIRHCEDVRVIRPEWTQMRVLLLTRSAFAEADAAAFQHMPQLEELELRACKIMKRSFEFISGLKQMKRLILAETELTDASLLQICNHLHGLVALDISHTDITDVGTEGLCRLQDLEILHLDTAGVSNRSLAHVSSLKKLRRLDLFGANVTDSGLIYLQSLKSLEELEICSGTISNRGVAHISKIRSLKALNLSQNRNIDAKATIPLQWLVNLRHLNLSNTSIPARFLRNLYPLKDLQTLSVYGCELTQDLVEALQAMLPKLQCLRCA